MKDCADIVNITEVKKPRRYMGQSQELIMKTHLHGKKSQEETVEPVK